MTYVTGARGFIGSHLVRRLDPSKTISIPHHCITEFRMEHFERFYFLSSYGNLSGQTDWNQTMTANVLQPISALLECLAKDTTGTLVFVSSSSVTLPVQTAYSRCKLASEEVLLSASDKLRICIARPYSVTGVGEQSSHLIPTLIRSCYTGEPMPFYPDATHDYIDVEDVVDGLLALSNPGVYELGRGWPVTNEEVKNLVERTTGCKANVTIQKQGRTYDNGHWFCTGPKPEGWTPKVSLERSICNMVEAYASQ